MMMVLVCHTNGYIGENDLTEGLGALRLLTNQFTLVCVNVFVMISGWFRIKASWKGACKLLFQVLYVTLLCSIVFLILGLPVSFRKDILPNLMFGTGYWFVVSYMILYALSPILNAYTDHAGQKEFGHVLIAWLSVEFIYGFLLDAGHFAFGFSPLHFAGLYLLARYARLYPGKLFSFGKGTDLAIYVGLSLISALIFWFSYKRFGMGFHLNHYDSPLAIAASLYLLLAFSKMHFQSRAVNWLASSAFAIYLIHTNSLVYPRYLDSVESIRASFGFPVSAFVLLGSILLVAMACILLDRPRIFLWGKISPVLTPSQKQ